MKVVSVINYKGGVGKTTLTANLGSEMALRGKKVLLIDLDPQTNLTFSYMKEKEWAEKYEKEKTIKSWFDAILGGIIPLPSFQDLVVERNGVDLICSHLGLINVDVELAVGVSSGTEAQHRRNYIRTYSYIRNAVKSLEERYDIVLFDCPPNFGVVTQNALIASDCYIVPAKMDYLSTLGINELRNHVEDMKKSYNHYIEEEKAGQEADPRFLGVIATMISLWSERPIKANELYIGQLKRNGIAMFETMLRENKTIYGDAAEYGEPVVLKQFANVRDVDRKVVAELKELTDEFMRKVGI